MKHKEHATYVCNSKCDDKIWSRGTAGHSGNKEKLYWAYSAHSVTINKTDQYGCTVEARWREEEKGRQK